MLPYQVLLPRRKPWRSRRHWKSQSVKNSKLLVFLISLVLIECFVISVKCSDFIDVNKAEKRIEITGPFNDQEDSSSERSGVLIDLKKGIVEIYQMQENTIFDN